MKNPIRKVTTKAGTVVWQVDGRRYNANPARPQFPTKEQAEEALAKMIEQRGAGLHPSRRDVTFEMLADAFMRHARGQLANKTLRTYASTLKVHLLPAFGNKRVIDINPKMVKDFLTAKRESNTFVKVIYAGGGDRRDRTHTIPVEDFDSNTMRKVGNEEQRQLSASAVQQLRAILSAVLTSAVDDQVIPSNPVAAAKGRNRGRKARVAAKQAIAKERPFTAMQQAALLAWSGQHDPELHDLIFLMLKTGCRPGEARALHWQDFIGDDQSGYKLLIERSADDYNEITETKTGNKRAVDVSVELSAMLKRRYRERQLKGARPEDYVFGNGVPLVVRNLGRRFELAMRKCSIVGHVPYDCRHTFASTLLTLGAPILYVAHQLGHADAGTTFKHYAHWMPSEGRRFVDLLDGAAPVERDAMKA